MKRILCILLTLLMLTPAVSAAGEFTLIGGAAEGKVGETVTYTVKVENAPTCASYKIILTYDPQVLEVVEGKNAGSGGLFIVNTKAKYQEKPAINTVAADAAKVIEGTADLYSVTFKILASPNEGTQPLEIAYQEFFTPELDKVTPSIQAPTLTIISEAAPEPPAETPEDPAVTPEPPAETPAPKPEQDQPAEPTPPAKEDEMILPPGNWTVDEGNNEVVYVPESSEEETITFIPELPEDLRPGTPTDVPVKNEEGQDVGTITVEREEDGSISVIDQELHLPKLLSKNPLPLWGWILIGAVGVAGVAGIVFAIVFGKKKKEK